MTTRTAHCSCGEFRVEAEGEPLIVSLCNCTHCQRRTGSPFGLGAWYPKERVKIVGDHRTYIRKIEDREVPNHFCSNCGGVVLWEATKRQGQVAIAVGMFADPSFPPPNRSIYEDTKHPWIVFTHEMSHD